MSRRGFLALVSAVAAGEPAWAQRTADNPVTAAEDAFGTSIGNESVGLYSSSQVRGFSPVTAGNVRIEGVYIDRQGAITPRLVSSSTIRVGLTAQGYLFPAPTGIVDYRLRDIGDRPLLSIVAGSYAYGAPTVEIDAQLPIDGARLGIAGGLSYGYEKYYDGADAHYVRAAIVPRWRPAEGVEIIPFWSTTIGRDEEVAPTIITAGSQAPPEAPRRRFFGQRWAAKDSENTNAGMIARARIDSSWSVVAGAFRSILINEQNFADLFVGTTPDGRTRERLIADPGQRYASTSGELRLSRSVTEGPRLHALHASLRARQIESRYGGAASPLDLGERPLGVPVPVEAPASFAFGARTRDSVRHTTIGLAYEGRWRDVGEINLGVQRADYRKRVALPGAPAPAGTHDRPWLFNGALAAHLTDDLALYASYTRGLEESGLAPNNAANRNEALPAIRTRQFDAGIRWAMSPRMRLVAGAFEVRKPYFSTDENNVYTVLGDVRHRGIELSLSGTPLEEVSLLAGAVLMKPSVTGEDVDSGRVGRRPLGQAETVLRANIDYRPPILQGLSFDLGVSHTGSQPASRDNLVLLESYTLIDLGARYRFRLGKAPATLRLQMLNATDVFYWRVSGSNSYGLTDGRRATATLAFDL